MNAYEHLPDFQSVTHAMNDLNDAIVMLAEYVDKLSDELYELHDTIKLIKKKQHFLFSQLEDDE